MPIPSNLTTRITTIGEVRDAPADEPVVNVTTKTLRHWIDGLGGQLADDTGDREWRFLSMHDLRRTWATALRNEDVDAEMVLEWGGWDDLETFLDHYKDRFSPEAQRRARDQVEWL